MQMVSLEIGMGLVKIYVRSYYYLHIQNNTNIITVLIALQVGYILGNN